MSEKQTDSELVASMWPSDKEPPYTREVSRGRLTRLCGLAERTEQAESDLAIATRLNGKWMDEAAEAKTALEQAERERDAARMLLAEAELENHRFQLTSEKLVQTRDSAMQIAEQFRLDMLTARAARDAALVRRERERLLEQFYRQWQTAASNRGCYSCAEDHDSRCEKARGIGKCTCGRDELDRLDAALAKEEATK